MGKNITIIALFGLVIFIGLNNMSTTQSARDVIKERDSALEEVERLKHENSLYIQSTCLKRMGFGYES